MTRPKTKQVKMDKELACALTSLNNRRTVYEEKKHELSTALEQEVPDVTVIEETLPVLRSVHNQLIIAQEKYNQMLQEAGRMEEFQNEDNQLLQLSIQMKQLEVKAKKIVDVEDDWDTMNESASRRSSIGASSEARSGNTSCQRSGASSSQRCGDSSGQRRVHPRYEDFSDQRRRLPKLNLPRFSGDIRQWLPFWSQFQEIHEDNRIATSDKFQYLLQAMVENSDAYKIIASYPLSAENYPLALDNLKQRFGRKELLVKVYVRDLLCMVIENANNKDISFSDLHTKLSSQIRALGSLGVTTDACASIVYPVVESCLPVEILRAWQRDRAYREAKGCEDELNKLMEFLDTEVKGEDNIRLACGGLAYEEKAESKSRGRLNRSTPTTAAHLMSTDQEKKKRCVFCSLNHSSAKCGKASSLSLEDKYRILKENRACFNCLNVGHAKKMCKSFVKCINCSGKHETIMCSRLSHHNQRQRSAEKPEEKSQQKSAVEEQAATSTNSLVSFNSSPEVLLQTLIVKIHCQRGAVEARAVIDTGAQRSYILKTLAEKIGLESKGEETVIHGLFGGSQSNQQKHNRYNIVLSDLEDMYRCNFMISDAPKITGNIQSVPEGPWITELRSMKIPISDVGRRSQPVDILIGADVAGKLFTGKMMELKSGPVAIHTRLGWTVMGKLPVEWRNISNKSNQNVNIVTSGTDAVMSLMSTILHTYDVDVPKLWELEPIGIESPVDERSKKDSENETLQEFLSTVSKNEEGRYEVKLPWIKGHPPIPDNQWVAERRLKTTTTRLIQDGTLESYDKLFKLWESDGIIEEVPGCEERSYGHYLPHRAVYKPESTTTPIRPVFDASCKMKKEPSLNECLECGPNLLEQIPVIISRFRLDLVGVTADIKKAFQQISVDPKDRDMMRFLWWKDLSCQELKIYRHRRVVFGVNSSPFILAATLKHLEENCEDKYKPVADVLSKSFYVDNLVTAVSNNGEAVKLKNDAIALMSDSKFELREWEIGPADDGKDAPLLGLIWNKKDDTLRCDVKTARLSEDVPVTKRRVLAVAHSVFDPIGFVCPFTLVPKLLLQEAWKLKTGWDTELPEDMVKKFKKWMSQIPALSELKIPRCVISLSMDKNNWSLHVFVDASKVACAACVFLRIDISGQVAVHLMMAKSRVSPLKEMTIPRLELTSCVIGVRLTKMVKQILEVEDISTTYWSDSSTAIHWIQNDDNWGIYVQRRVAEIRSLSNPSDWRHVPGEMNPADIPSRGATAAKLLETRWWEGPRWLYESEDKWPKLNVPADRDDVEKEMKKTVTVALGTNNEYGVICTVARHESFTSVFIQYKFVWDEKFAANFFSSHTNLYWMKIFFIRCKALMSRNCTLSTYHEMLEYVARLDGIQDPTLDANGLRAAEKKLLVMVQNMTFTGAQDIRLKKFETLKNEDGLLRIKTRMDYGDFDESFKFPVVLPSESPVVKALIMEQHLENSHAGVQFLLAKLRSTFWILKGRQTIRNVLRKCEECVRFSAKKMQCQPPPLPKDRVEARVPFEITGVDLTGPLNLRDGRKVWITLFTCAVYRAVHMELVTSLSTDDFRAALRRFVARRGRPRVIYSDNGTNFVGCNNGFKKINWKKIQQSPFCRPIEWKFNPPTAAWWGGWWERIIGVVKQSLRKVLGKDTLTYEELLTVICDVEAVVNQRPITYTSEDVNDPVPITPYAFLIGNTESTLPEADAVDGSNVRKSLKYLQLKREDLKRRFQKEYLGQLFSARSGKEKREVKVGDTVLVGEDNRKRVDWSIGRIVDLFPSRDGKVRLVKLRTEDGEFLRPIQRIYPFEIPGNGMKTFNHSGGTP